MAVSHKTAQSHSCDVDLNFFLSLSRGNGFLSHHCSFRFTPVLCVGFLTMLKVLFGRVYILISLSADTFLYLQTLAHGFKFFSVCKIMEFFECVSVCVCGEGRDPPFPTGVRFVTL